MSIPQIFFESGYLFDLKYDLDHPDDPISETSKPRVQELIQIFDQIWTEEGLKFMTATIEEIGLPFKRKELSCTVTVSPDQFSCSHPLIINAARFYSLSYFSEIDKLRFIETLHHEILHRYLDEHFEKALDIGSNNPSALILKYANEDIFTHAHIHLYALQQIVFKRLGLHNEWDQVIKWVAEIPNKGYQKALEIVDSEGALAFVEELRSLVR